MILLFVTLPIILTAALLTILASIGRALDDVRPKEHR